jgi:hypothetical protein
MPANHGPIEKTGYRTVPLREALSMSVAELTTDLGVVSGPIVESATADQVVYEPVTTSIPGNCVPNGWLHRPEELSVWEGYIKQVNAVLRIEARFRIDRHAYDFNIERDRWDSRAALTDVEDLFLAEPHSNDRKPLSLRGTWAGKDEPELTYRQMAELPVVNFRYKGGPTVDALVDGASKSPQLARVWAHATVQGWRRLVAPAPWTSTNGLGLSGGLLGVIATQLENLMNSDWEELFQRVGPCVVCQRDVRLFGKQRRFVHPECQIEDETEQRSLRRAKTRKGDGIRDA